MQATIAGMEANPIYNLYPALKVYMELSSTYVPQKN